MAITRTQVITKYETLAGAGRARVLGDYIVIVIPGEESESPIIVAVQDGVRDYVFCQHAHDPEPTDYVAGPWEALITG